MMSRLSHLRVSALQNVQRSTFNAQRSTLNGHLCSQRRSRRPSATPLRLRISASLRFKTAYSVSFFLLAAFCASAARDPFWPIGYEPPKPEPEAVEPVKPAVPDKPPAPKKPAPPPVAPITEDDWKAARALLAVSGFTQSRHPVSGETRTLAMINRASFTVGDTLTVTNANIHFVWSIESLAGLALKLKQVRADRLPPHPLPAN